MKPITPMKRLKPHIDAISDMVDNIFYLKYLNKRKSIDPNVFSNGRKSIDFDCVLLFSTGSPNGKYNPNKRKDQESFGISFNYKSDPENPTILFSVERAGEQVPLYSDTIMVEDAKLILNKFKDKLNESENLNSSAILDLFEFCIFGVANKQEIKERIDSIKDIIPIKIEELAKSEEKQRKLIYKESSALNSISANLRSHPDNKKIQDLNQLIRKLENERKELEEKQEQKRKSAFNSPSMKKIRIDKEQSTKYSTRLRQELKQLAQQSGMSSSELESLIDLTEKRMVKKSKLKP